MQTNKTWVDLLLSGSEAALPPDEAAPTHSSWICPSFYLFTHQTLLYIEYGF